MNELLEWIKANVKEGVDIKAAEKLVAQGNPLSSIESREDAIALIERTPALKSAMDAQLQKASETAVSNFQEKKLPGLLKEEGDKIRKELNPEETPEQKELRELRQRLEAKDKQEAEYQLKQELRQKAAEIAKKKGVEYDPLKAERFSVFGEDAEKFLADDIDYHKSNIDKVLEVKLKGQHRLTDPQGGNPPAPADLNAEIQKAKEAGDAEKATRLYLQKQRQEAQ